MKIFFSKHSLKKLEERGISRGEVEKILRDPDEVLKGKHGRSIAHKHEDDKLIRVVYIEMGEERYRIVTAYKTRPGRYD